MNILEELYKEIQYWTSDDHRAQMIDELWELRSEINTILNKLNSEDWKQLKVELIHWNDLEMRVLSEVIMMGDEGKNVVSNNFIFGYIFKIIENNIAEQYLIDDLEEFLLERSINSIECIDGIIEKLKILKNNNQLKESNFYENRRYSYWNKLAQEVKKQILLKNS